MSPLITIKSIAPQLGGRTHLIEWEAEARRRYRALLLANCERTEEVEGGGQAQVARFEAGQKLVLESLRTWDLGYVSDSAQVFFWLERQGLSEAPLTEIDVEKLKSWLGSS